MDKFSSDISLVKHVYIPIFLVIFAIASVIPALSYITYLVTENEGLTTLVIGIFGLSYALSSIPVGVIHQILRREYLLIELGIVIMALSGILFFTRNPILYLISRGIIGFAEALIFVGFIGLVVEKYSKTGEAAPILGRLFGIMGLALLIAPAVGSVFIEYSAYNTLFIIYILLLIIAILIIADKTSYRVERHISNEIKISNINPYLLLSIIMVVSVGASDGTFQSRPVLWLMEYLLNPKNAGYLMTAYYISSIISQLTLPSIARKIGYRKGILINLIISLVTLSILSISTGYYSPFIRETLLFITAFLIGLDVGILSPYGTELVTRIFGENLLLGSGTANTIWAIGYFLIPAVLAYISLGYIIDILTVLILHITGFIVVFIFQDKF